MTLLGKIFTVLIFIMSVAFCILAVATFATHRNWKDVATAHSAKITELQTSIQEKSRELQSAKDALALEQASRRAAIATLQAKLTLVAADVQDYAKRLGEASTQLTAQTAAAKEAETLLAEITKEVNKLREDVRLAQQDRDEQFLKAVDLTDKHNQAESLLARLKEQHNQLQEQLAQLNHVAERMGFSKDVLVSAIPPPLDGIVTAVDENKGLVEVSLGSDDGLRKGHVLQVFRGDQFLGQIILREVNADRSIGDIDKKLRRGKIRKDDNVTTKLS